MNSCVLDADVVIGVLDRSDSHHRAAVRALRRIADAGTRMSLSLVNYAEALVLPAEHPETLRAAAHSIDALGIELVAPTPAVAREAALLRAQGISLADGFAIATARARDAGLASFDRRVRSAARRAGLELA
jgi:predicted nucleic acid-binding protein